MSIKILIADEQNLVRKGIRALLGKHPGMKVIAEADNGRMLLEQVRKHKPDVVITEILLPDLNGVEATRQICEEFDTVRVIVLSMLCDRASVERMFGAGAMGYLTKNCTFHELVEAINTVKENHRYLSARIADIVAEDYALLISGKKPSVSLDLMEREREVTQLYAEGWSTKEIAAHLNLSVKTIETYFSRIKEKLGVKGVAGLTKYAIREQLTSLYQA